MMNFKMTIQTKADSSALVTDGVGTDILQGTAIGIGAMAIGLIGAWSLSCVAAGAMVAGSPWGLVTSWIEAVSGM